MIHHAPGRNTPPHGQDDHNRCTLVEDYAHIHHHVLDLVLQQQEKSECQVMMGEQKCAPSRMKLAESEQRNPPD